MSELFGRQVVLQVGDLQVRNLRIAFSVVRSTKEEPNTATISIYNMKEETRARLAKEPGLQVYLSAGYESGGGLLFAGQTRKGGVGSVKQGPDWVTKLECGDGAGAYSTANASVSLAKGSSAKDVVLALVKALKVEPGNVEAALAKGNFRQGLTSYPSGYAFRGKASVGLSQVLASLGLQWSVQDGKLQVLRPAETTEGQALLLSPSSGLIGSPEYATPDKKGGAPTLRARSLLRAELRPGLRVVIRSREIDGAFKCLKVTHAGDTHGTGDGSWSSDGDFVAVSA